ncbi:19244_t:CDS:1, partial [Gigaspora rosea]
AWSVSNSQYISSKWSLSCFVGPVFSYGFGMVLFRRCSPSV